MLQYLCIKNPQGARLAGFFELVGRDRFELSTNGLKVRCSTG